MNGLQREALSFVESLQTLYFENRNLSALLPSMSEDISWIGTGGREFCRDIQSAQEAMALEGQEYDGNFTLVSQHWDACCLSDDACVVYGEIIARPDDAKFAEVHNRVTVVCKRMQEGMKLVHLHMSAPDADQEDGHYYVKSTDFAERETLRLRSEKISRELRERNIELEALTENIPGGVHQCKHDDCMTFISMSNSFLNLLEYSKEDVNVKFHNHFAEMIYPEDLQRLHEEIAQQLSRGDNLELEYRIMRGDGKLLWILDQSKLVSLADGSRCFYCVLVDITAQKEQREELRLTLERQQIIMDQTTDIIFEWDILKDTLSFSPNWHKKFGYEPLGDNISKKLPRSNKIHPEDMYAFVKIMQDTAKGVPYSETEFRISDVFGNFRWQRIRATVQYDENNRAIKAVGVILDIDTDKKQKQRLLEQAQRDPLTSLYNKAAVRELVTRQISENTNDAYHMLLIIDVDNFKGVNDVYGHLCGDSLLSDVASVLKNHFRVNDIVGRIGGDEFLVYLSQMSSQAEAADKISSLLTVLSRLKPVKDAATISCSIGAAFFPQKEADYFTLYKYADSALYTVKARGKNSFAFYEQNGEDSEIETPLAGSAVGGIDSEMASGDAVGDQLVQYTFRMLYDSIDVTTAVGHLLEIVGKAYDVSRVYIFESSPDGRSCNNTFEWCNEGITPEIDKLQGIDYEADLGGYMKNFNEKNIFHCQDIRTLHPDLYAILASQGICSVLQCAIMDDGVFKGYVGFDECRENRSWTSAQTASLTLISNILSTFLLKLRLKQGLMLAQGSV